MPGAKNKKYRGVNQSMRKGLNVEDVDKIKLEFH